MNKASNEPNPYPRLRKGGVLSYRHRDIAALKVGRALEAGETVHHRNGDKTDWHPDNIVIFSSHSAHMVFENYQLRKRKGILELFSIEEILKLRGEWMLT